MSVTSSVSQRSPINQTTEPLAVSSFTKEKITRVVLRILSALALLGAIVVGANVIAGTITAWHAFTSFCLYVAYDKLDSQADHTFDLNDPRERQLASDYLRGRSFPCMLQLYPPDTILQYELVPLDGLRRECYYDLGYTAQYRGYIPYIVIENANQLLNCGIITPEMHRMIVQNDLEAILRLHDNTLNVETLFN